MIKWVVGLAHYSREDKLQGWPVANAADSCKVQAARCYIGAGLYVLDVRFYVLGGWACPLVEGGQETRRDG